MVVKAPQNPRHQNTRSLVNDKANTPEIKQQQLTVFYRQQRGPLSLVSTIEELPGRKSSGSRLESREYGPRYPPR
jgi:hypothetical protein